MGKLHSAVRHQFPMAASTDGEEPAEELPKSCKDFYNQKSAPLPSQELVEQLGAIGCQDVGFDQGTIQSLLAGLLQYNAPGSPSNLSVFCFYEKLRDGSENEEMVLLWVMQKDGKTRSQEDIEKSLKQVVVAPSKLGDMKDQLRIYIGVLSILFGKQRLLP